jgi:hypothetical protein
MGGLVGLSIRPKPPVQHPQPSAPWVLGTSRTSPRMTVVGRMAMGSAPQKYLQRFDEEASRQFRGR